MPIHPNSPFAPRPAGSPGRAPSGTGAYYGGEFFPPKWWLPAGVNKIIIDERIQIPEDFRSGDANRQYVRIVIRAPAGTRPAAIQKKLLAKLVDIVDRPSEGRYIDSEFIKFAKQSIKDTGALP